MFIFLEFMIDIEKIKKGKTTEELLEFGIINIDKSSGPTSFNVSHYVKKKLNLRKTSHFGTLDPKVTGVLPVSLNRACKLMGFFLGEDKEYIGIMQIHEDREMADIQKVINNNFLGKIKQTPPVKSRVKRQEREREIVKFDLLEQEGKNILFHVVCQGGTYIRKLLDDLGTEMNIGAHMLELRRTRAGIFTEESLVNLYDFTKAVEEYEKGNDELLRKIIVPGEIVSQAYPIVYIKEEEIKPVLQGRPLYNDFLIEKPKMNTGEIISVFCGERFIGMFKVLNGEEFFAKAEFTFQELME